jgi:hypothetical protein
MRHDESCGGPSAARLIVSHVRTWHSAPVKLSESALSCGKACHLVHLRMLAGLGMALVSYEHCFMESTVILVMYVVGNQMVVLLTCISSFTQVRQAKLGSTSELAVELLAKHQQEEFYSNLSVSVLEVRGLRPRRGACISTLNPETRKCFTTAAVHSSQPPAHYSSCTDRAVQAGTRGAERLPKRGLLTGAAALVLTQLLPGCCRCGGRAASERPAQPGGGDRRRRQPKVRGRRRTHPAGMHTPPGSLARQGCMLHHITSSIPCEE